MLMSACGGRTLRSPLWLGSPGQMNPPWPGLLFEAAKQPSCLSILVSAASMRWTVCGWRKRQITQKRGRYGPTSLERGYVATDPEANEGLLDEWGRPKSQKHQNES